MHYNKVMPVQYQEQNRPMSFAEEEAADYQKQHAPGARKTKPKREKKPFHLSAGGIIGVITACAICLGAGHYIRNSTLFMEKRTVDHYLPVEEYVFVDEDTGKYVQDVRTLKFDNKYVYEGGRSSYLRTSRGLKPGDSWEKFVQEYGEFYADTIYTSPVGEDGYTIYDPDSVHIYDPMMVKDFDEQYVKTGIVDPDKMQISVNFRVRTDGVKLYYTETEFDRLRDSYYEHPLRHLSSYPDLNEFSLSFEFAPEIYSTRDSTGLDYIYSTYYN